MGQDNSGDSVDTTMMPSTSRTMDQTAYCVFRRGAVWFAVPACVLRRVTDGAGLVAVPGSPQVLAGICHRQGEFLPVLSLDPLPALNSKHGNALMLVVEDLTGNWGLLVDEIKALARLDVSSSPESVPIGRGDPLVIGWATYAGQVVRVLNYSLLREMADRELSSAQSRRGAPAAPESFRSNLNSSHS